MQNTPAVWYVFAGTGDIVTFSLCSSAVYTDTELGIYSGTDCTNSSCVAANDDFGPSCANFQSSIAVTTTIGLNYYIKVFSYNTFTPNFNFTLTATCVAPPPPLVNDAICNAIPIACGGATTGTTVGATIGGAGETGVCAGYAQNTPGVWYSIVGNGSTITVSLCNTSPSVDSQLAIFSGSCSNPVCVAANDDYGPSCATTQSSIAFLSQVGVTYYIRVWRWSFFYNPNGTIGNFAINVNCSFSGPPNDPCAGATAVGVPYNSGLVSVAQATSATDGTVPTIASCGNNALNLNNTLWYAVEGDGTTYTASTISTSTNFDTEIQVFSGTCGALTAVTCSNLTGAACTNAGSETVTWCSAVGTIYYVLIGSETLNCANSNFVLTINSTAVPAGATLYNNDMIWRGGNGVAPVKTIYPFTYDSGEDWTIPSNWYIYDSINDNFVQSVTTVPNLTTNVFIPKLGGCTTKLPIIFDNKEAYAKDLSIMSSSRLIFGHSSVSAQQGSIEIKGDLKVSGQLVSGVGTNFSTTANGATTTTNKGTGLVKFTGSNNQTITYAEMTATVSPTPVLGIVNFYDLEINNIGGTNTGLVLNLPIYVFHDVKMLRGNILSSTTNHFILGYIVACALVQANSYPATTALLYGIPASPSVATVTWSAGSVVGPMFRYNRTSYTAGDPNSLYPVGGLYAGDIMNRNAYLKWSSGTTANGFLRAQYVPGAVPFTTGMPLTDLTPTSVNLTNVATEGYWEIHPYTNFTTASTTLFTTSPTYTLSLRANQYPSIAQNWSASRIIKAPGAPTLTAGTWQLNGIHNGSNGQSTDFTVSRNGMNSFSIFAIAVPTLSLSVEFIGANWECMDNYVDFHWATASEHNSAYFRIETSDDGYSWNTYGEVQAAGNSTEQLEYRLGLVKPANYLGYVRLSEMDQDGTLSQLGIYGISCSEGGNLFTYPNPSENGFHLNIDDNELNGLVKIELTDSKGSKILEESSLEVKEGINSYYFNTTGLAPGMYYIKVSNETRSVIVKHSLR